MLKNTLVVIFVISWTCMQAQSPTLIWLNYIDGELGAKKDKGNAIALDSEGNAYVTGIVFENESKGDLITAAYNSTGEQLFVDYYNGDNSVRSEGNDLVISNDGNVYVTGIVSQNEGDICLLKFNENGNIWRKSYEPWFMASYYDEAKEIAMHPSGDICLAGRVESISGNMADTYTARYDEDGNLVWGIDYSGASDADYASGIAISNTGLIYTSTSAFNFFGSTTQDIQTLCYNEDGINLWTSNFTGSAPQSADWSMDIAVDPSDNTVVCGSTDNTGSSDFAIRFQNSYGTPLWNYLKDGTAHLNDTCHFASFHPFGAIGSGHILEEYNNTTIQRIYTVLFDSSGNILWEEYYPEGGSNAAVKEMKVDESGNIYLCGWIETPDQSKNGIILMYNSQGDLLHEISFNSEFNSDDIFNDLEISSNAVYVTGQTFTTLNNSFMITAKYGLGNTLVADMTVIGEEMTISPNPATDNISISVPQSGEPSFLFIYDVEGKMICKEVIENNGKIVNISSIPAGLYTAVLCSGNNRKHGRFLKI